MNKFCLCIIYLLLNYASVGDSSVFSTPCPFCLFLVLCTRQLFCILANIVNSFLWKSFFKLCNFVMYQWPTEKWAHVFFIIIGREIPEYVILGALYLNYQVTVFLLFYSNSVLTWCIHFDTNIVNICNCSKFGPLFISIFFPRNMYVHAMDDTLYSC